MDRATSSFSAGRTRSAIRIVAALLILALASSCSTDDGGPDRLADRVGPLPAPTGEVVLTIVGEVTANVGDEAQADLDGIESLGTQTVVIDEPFLNREIEFTGVPVATVLAAAGIDPETPLVWTALDDYQVRFSGDQAAAEDALLATRQDGQPIEIADGGPIRVVFPDPDGDLARDTNQWIWSIHRIDAG